MGNTGSKFKIYIRYGYSELYPKEEYETTEDYFHISQVGMFNFVDMVFCPNIGDCFEFKIDEEIKVEHDITVGLPVYIIVN